MKLRFLAILALLVGAAISVPQGQQADSGGGRWVPGEVLVTFRSSASTPRRDQLLATRRARLLRRFERMDTDHIELPANMTVAAAVAAFSALPEVAGAQPNYLRQIVGAASPTTPNDPLFGNLWGLEKIKAPQVWSNFSTGSSDVIIADVDTGVNYLHPDLAANMWHNPGETPGNGIDDDHNGYVDDVYGIDTRNHDSDPMDDHGHGTHTSGTIGAVGNNDLGVVGVGWNTKILACKFIGTNGSGSDSGAVECFNYITALKQRGVNIRATSNSWGGPRPGTAEPASMKTAIENAGAVGILTIAAAGNDSANNDATPYDPASINSATIIAVAASGSDDSRAGFSSYGATSVDLAAPGVGILSTTSASSYGEASGTSMATPHVAGAVGLLAAIDPTQSALGIKALILNNVDVLPEWAGKVLSGGRLNVFGAASATGSNPLSVVSVTAPAAGSTFTAPATISVTADATDVNGVSSVAFYADGTSIGSDATFPYGITWSNVAGGPYQLTAVVTDGLGATTTSAAVSILVTSQGTGGTGAVFVKTDSTTRGDWIGNYGVDGYGIVDTTFSWPSYAQVVSSAAPYTWSQAPTDTRALQRPGGVGRIASTWYGSIYTIDITITDGQFHQLALYCVDWDNAGRSQRFEMIDAASGGVMDSRTVSGFSGGRYVVWTIGGHVLLRVTNTGPVNAVVSGLFFGGAGAPNPPPTVSITSPAGGTAFTAPASITVAADAADATGITSVAFYANGSPIGTDSSFPYSVTWGNVAANSYSLTAIATDSLGATTTSAAVSITVNPPAGGASSATFVSVDTTTRGSWIGTYGADGYAIANSTAGLPGYAHMLASGSLYTWDPSSSDTRALQWPSGAGRIASTWYSSNFDLDVDVTDGQTHQVALYVVDWENAGRAERIDVLDWATLGVLDSRTVSTFSGGRYLVWTIGGHVVIRVTNTGAANAVVSGVFFGGGGSSNPAPTVSITAPAGGTTYTAPAAVGVTADAADANGIASVAFFANGAPIGTDTTAPYAASWSNVAAGTYLLTAIATDSLGATTTSAAVSITVDPPSGGGGGGGAASATFVSVDSTTRGSWIGAYGADGQAIADISSGLPAYAHLASTGSLYTWDPAPSDTRALQRPSGVGRIASTWYSSAFDLDVDLTDGQTHQVALYVVDWENAGRAERIDVLDAVTGGVLDSRTVSSFSFGRYLVWTIGGHVVIRVTNTGAANAVVSGVFFGGAGGGGGGSNPPPTVSITLPAGGTTFTAPAVVSVTADAADANGIASVAFFANGAPIGSDTTAPYAATWSDVAAGTYLLTAVATDGLGATTTSAAVSITVNPPAGGGGGGGGGGASSAAFEGVDTTTRGSWIGAYGLDGHAIANVTSGLPGYAHMTSTGSLYTWDPAPSDPRALQQPGGAGRIASAWYGSSFDFDIDITDGQSHEMAIYLVDWENAGRSERIDVLDAATGAVLDSRTVTTFSGGRYLVWTVTGHVVVRVTNMGGSSAVVSGIFFGPASAPAATIAVDAASTMLVADARLRPTLLGRSNR